MADQSDVEACLVSLIGQALYPNGATQNPPSPSVMGAPVRIFRGWPNGLQLDKDLAAGLCNVTVYAPPGADRNTSRFASDWQVDDVVPTPTLTATVQGVTVTLGGAVQTPANVAVKVGLKAYLYAVQSTDTFSTIATALATEIAADYPGTSAAAGVITIADPAGVVAAAVGGYINASRELRRQQKIFQITCWSPTPPLRDALASAVDSYLAGIERFVLPDDFVARLIYQRTTQNDIPEKEKLFRRDLFYSVEYPTTQTASFAQIVAFTAQVEPTDPSSPVFLTPPVVAGTGPGVVIPPPLPNTAAPTATPSYVGGDSILRTPTIVISADKVVKGVGDTDAAYPDITNVADAELVLGVTQNGVNPGGSLFVQISGEITNAAWTWSKGPVFVGPGGQLVQAIPAGAAWLRQVGVALAADRILLNLQPPTLL